MLLDINFFTQTDAVGKTECQLAHISFLLLIAATDFIVLYAIDFLDEIHQLRVFFSTPTPFLILMAMPHKRLPKE